MPILVCSSGAVFEVWDYLHKHYGGGPVIRRNGINGLYEGMEIEPSPGD